MKKDVRWVLIPGLLLALAFALPMAAQDEPIVLGLGDEVTGIIQADKPPRYTLDIEDVNDAFDIVLVSPMNSRLHVYDEQGNPIQFIDRMGDHGYEVYTWQPGDEKPAQVVAGLWSGTGEYSLSILPVEQPISEDPIPGEQVKRWAELDIEQGDKTRTVTVSFLLYVPEDYDTDQSYPFLLFLHGYGETGNRLDFLKRQVIPKLIEEGEDYPFIIASPQVNFGEDWADNKEALASLVTHLQSEFPIDPNRIYVTGLSMGGSGAWHFALAYPELPAAVAPLAGYYTFGSPTVPENICDLVYTPLWVFHGGEDEIVRLDWEEALVDAVKECGGDIKFTLYPDADHEQTFVRGYSDPVLYEWLLDHHK